MVLGVASSLAFLVVDLNTSGWAIAGIAFLRGIAFGACLMPLQTATYATVTPRSMGRATSIFSTGRQVASSLSVAILITVLTTRTHFHLDRLGSASAEAAHHASLLAFHDAFIVSALIGLVGLAFSLLINDRDAEATMARIVPETGTTETRSPALELVA
jgi:MFS family permease